MMRNSTAALIAATVLLLAGLYVGSYLALLEPPPQTYNDILARRNSDYRWGGRWVDIIFWPAQQIDRRVRPSAWEWERG
jgi:hypothetical protein